MQAVHWPRWPRDDRDQPVLTASLGTASLPVPVLSSTQAIPAVTLRSGRDTQADGSLGLNAHT